MTAAEIKALREVAEDEANRANASQIYALLAEVGFTRDSFIELGESRRDNIPYSGLHKAVRVSLFRLAARYKPQAPAYPVVEEDIPPMEFTPEALTAPPETSASPVATEEAPAATQASPPQTSGPVDTAEGPPAEPAPASEGRRRHERNKGSGKSEPVSTETADPKA